MKKTLLSTLLLLTIAMPAYAQNQAAFCKLWFTHKNVKSADYEAGVDVEGKPVKPADLNDQSGIFSGDAIRIPLTIDLAEQLEGKLPDGTEMQAGISMISISRNGKVTLDDQDISDSAYEVCTGEKPPMKSAAMKQNEADAPAVKPAEVPLVKAPRAPEQPRMLKGNNDNDSVDGAMPDMVEENQPTGKDGIIWGESY